MRLKWLICVAAVMTAVMVGADLAAQQAPAPPTPIEAGTLTIHANVTIVFRLENR